MKTKKLEFSQSAREKITKGVSTLAEAVKATLGPRGRNVIIDKPGQVPHITKDGVTVAKSIVLKDPYENIGAQMVKQVAMKTADVAGDGTTTSTILAEAILKSGIKLVSSDHDPMSIKRGVEKAVAEVVKEVSKQSRPVESTEDIHKVAKISANGDEGVAKLISTAMEHVGHHGVITLEEGKSPESSLKTTKGYEFDRGMVDDKFCPDGSGRVVIENPWIWTLNGKIQGADMLEDILPALEFFNKKGEPVVIIAEDFDAGALRLLLQNLYGGALKCMAIKAPGFGDRRKEMLGDIATITGSNVRDMSVSDEPNIVANTDLSEFGRCARIEVDRVKTVITAYDTDEVESRVEDRIEEIKAQISAESDTWDKERTEQRLAKLTGGLAVISVGGATEVEIKEKKDRIEDALAATRAAIDEGIVPGGGVALARASKVLASFTTGDPEQDVGVRIVEKAIQEPLRQICKNAGEGADLILEQVRSLDDPHMGFDAAKLEFANMFDSGVVDPAKVTRVALQNAASVSSLMLTTECVVAEEPEDSGN